MVWASEAMTLPTEHKNNNETKGTKMSPTYSNGDIDGYTWTATNMPPSLCERVGVTSRTPSDALARLAAGAWQANHRHLYVAARSEMQRRGLLEASS